MSNDVVQGKVGEIGWDDLDVKQSSGEQRESAFLNMSKQGDYEMRIVSKPHQYYCHWVETKSGKRRKVNATMDGSDPICLEQNKHPQLKWLVKVLFRDPERPGEPIVKVLDAGSQIMGQIKRLHEDKKRFGNVSKYDIVINRGPKDARPLYTVQALGSERNPTPLTPDEKQAVLASSDPESDKFINIAKMCEPWTAERILAVINEEDPNRPKTATSATQEDSLFAADEDDEDFIDLDI